MKENRKKQLKKRYSYRISSKSKLHCYFRHPTYMRSLWLL